MINNINTLKDKILPKGKHKEIVSQHDRFKIADETIAPEDIKDEYETVIRKSFSIPKNEFYLLGKLRNRALDYKIVLSDSDLLRIGMKLVNELNDSSFHENISNLKKLKVGRKPNGVINNTI